MTALPVPATAVVVPLAPAWAPAAVEAELPELPLGLVLDLPALPLVAAPDPPADVPATAGVVGPGATAPVAAVPAVLVGAGVDPVDSELEQPTASNNAQMTFDDRMITLPNLFQHGPAWSRDRSA